jgi:hypothetical protein
MANVPHVRGTCRIHDATVSMFGILSAYLAFDRTSYFFIRNSRLRKDAGHLQTVRLLQLLDATYNGLPAKSYK